MTWWDKNQPLCMQFVSTHILNSRSCVHFLMYCPGTWRHFAYHFWDASLLATWVLWRVVYPHESNSPIFVVSLELASCKVINQERRMDDSRLPILFLRVLIVTCRSITPLITVLANISMWPAWEHDIAAVIVGIVCHSLFRKVHLIKTFPCHHLFDIAL
jgi:hypothetical protein